LGKPLAWQRCAQGPKRRVSVSPGRERKPSRPPRHERPPRRTDEIPVKANPPELMQPCSPATPSDPGKSRAHVTVIACAPSLPPLPAMGCLPSRGPDVEGASAPLKGYRTPSEPASLINLCPSNANWGIPGVVKRSAMSHRFECRNGSEDRFRFDAGVFLGGG